MVKSNEHVVDICFVFCFFLFMGENSSFHVKTNIFESEILNMAKLSCKPCKLRQVRVFFQMIQVIFCDKVCLSYNSLIVSVCWHIFLLFKTYSFMSSNQNINGHQTLYTQAITMREYWNNTRSAWTPTYNICTLTQNINFICTSFWRV